MLQRKANGGHGRWPSEKYLVWEEERVYCPTINGSPRLRLLTTFATRLSSRQFFSERGNTFDWSALFFSCHHGSFIWMRAIRRGPACLRFATDEMPASLQPSALSVSSFGSTRIPSLLWLVEASELFLTPSYPLSNGWLFCVWILLDLDSARKRYYLYGYQLILYIPVVPSFNTLVTRVCTISILEIRCSVKYCRSNIFKVV